MSATANSIKGGGYEDITMYKDAELVFCDIANIHGVRNAHNLMRDVGKTEGVLKSIKTYGAAVDDSNYM